MSLAPAFGMVRTSGDQASKAAAVSGRRVLGSGRAALEVSALGFGVMGMTYNRGPHPDKSRCIRLLREAADRGVTLFDTAIVYGPLNNEELAGEALGELRGKVCVTTKFGHEIAGGRATGRQDSRPATIRRYCEDSLRRLRVEAIPIFYQHRFDRNTPPEEVAGTLRDLIKEGKVLHWGMCEVGSDTIRRAHAVCPLTAVQSEYHLMHRDVEKNGVLETCRELGIGFVPYSPINRGFLGGGFGRVHEVRAGQRQPADPPPVRPGSHARQLPDSGRPAALRAGARNDVGAARPRLALAESPVDCPHSGHDQALAFGGEYPLP